MKIFCYKLLIIENLYDWSPSSYSCTGVDLFKNKKNKKTKKCCGETEKILYLRVIRLASQAS